MRSNNETNQLIKWAVIVADFIVLNILLLLYMQWWRSGMHVLPEGKQEMIIAVSNLTLLLSELRFSTLIHLRQVSAGDILRRVIQLTIVQALLSVFILKVIDIDLPVIRMVFFIGTLFFAVLITTRLIERWLVKRYRMMGKNTRRATFVGNDPELLNVYQRLVSDPTHGYRVLGYYGNAPENEQPREDGGPLFSNLERLGSLGDFINGMRHPEGLHLGDELYVCVSRREKELVRQISSFCDHHVIRFYFVPVSVETLGINLKRESLDDMEIFTTYENPLENPVNKTIKRLSDIILSLVFLIPTALLFPFIWLIIKMQSPGPIFFKQKRTGLDGRDFEMLKFRSMHVNADADKLQATKDDPRKFPFGNFMRKSNIDELPQFLNVLKGDMSIVGPRPHMLAHTEQYSKLIDKYMVRHFVKPGLTGWAQVTGFRGETRELWQMEGRVKRDIWYMEHWSIWLDIRIIWLTAKSIFIHDKNAY